MLDLSKACDGSRSTEANTMSIQTLSLQAQSKSRLRKHRKKDKRNQVKFMYQSLTLPSSVWSFVTCNVVVEVEWVDTAIIFFSIFSVSIVCTHPVALIQDRYAQEIPSLWHL